MIRTLIKKLNNFRFTAILTASISALAVVYALFSFFMFHFAGDLVPGETYIRQVGFYYHDAGGVLSFLVYLGFIGSVICGLAVAYPMIPFIKNKEKLIPRKGLLLVGVVGGVFELMLLILMIVLLTESPKTTVGIIISLPFGLLSTVGSLLYLFPYLMCNFFMPEISKK